MSRASGAKVVWVVFFSDGSIGGQADAAHGEGFRDWGFEVVKIASFLLSHGAQFVYTADDAYNPSVDPRHPGLVFPLPGPGMFAAMMHKLMYPHGKSSVACAGKGGNKGGKYMMEQARRMLMEQGHSGSPDEIMMVGDRFDTDVRAGLSAKFLTCLVTSGCHGVEAQQYYRTNPAHFHASGVGDLVPPDSRATAREAVQSLEVSSQQQRASTFGPPSEGCTLEEAAANLQAWALQQSSLLERAGTPSTRTELRPLLRCYFDAIDVDGDGTVDGPELLRACEHLGMGHMLQYGGGDGDDDSSLVSALRAAQNKSADGSLRFEAFASVVESALAHCGFDARKAWKKAALTGLAARLGNAQKMFEA